MGEPGGAGAVAEAAIALARALSIEVVAEGVESPEQAATLRRLGCDLAQGYLFSPACPSRRDHRDAARRRGTGRASNAARPLSMTPMLLVHGD